MMEIRGPMAADCVVAEPRPRAEDGRELISVKGLLEWAFAVECASLDLDEVGAVSGHDGGVGGVGAEWVIMQQLMLGKEEGEGVRVDQSFGRSDPHDDAEIVATLLRNTVRWQVAVWVADLARGCRVPKWDLGTPHLVPRNWGKRNHVGQMGRTEVIREVSYISRGRRRTRKDLWVPCEWVPSGSQIARAHRDYLDWWGALLMMRGALRAVQLKKFQVIEALPPMEPWKKSA